MKILNIAFLILLLISKNAFTMEDRAEQSAFQVTFGEEIHPNNFIQDMAKLGIFSIINTSSDIFTATEKVIELIKKIKLTAKPVPNLLNAAEDMINAAAEVDKVLKDTPLIDEASAMQLANTHKHRNLIETFKFEMKAKFALDLSIFTEEELNTQLQLLFVSNNPRNPANTKLKQSEEMLNKLAKLIVAGANPNIVTYISELSNATYSRSILSDIIHSEEFHRLIPVLLIFGADVNGIKFDYGIYKEGQSKLKEKFPHRGEFPKQPLFAAIHLPTEIAKDVINLLKNYNANLNIANEFGTISNFVNTNYPKLASLFENK